LGGKSILSQAERFFQIDGNKFVVDQSSSLEICAVSVRQSGAAAFAVAGENQEKAADEATLFC